MPCTSQKQPEGDGVGVTSRGRWDTKKRRTVSPSPAKSSSRLTQQKTTGMRGRQPALQAPGQQAFMTKQGTQQPEVAQRVSGMQAPQVLLEQVSQQQVQHPAAGELNQLSVLSGLVGSLSSLIHPLSNVSAPVVQTAASMVPLPVNSSVSPLPVSSPQQSNM